MPQNVPNWWTDNKVNETVNAQYVCSHLRPDEQQLLRQSPSFGAGLTDDTYLDWILNRARRFFLILVDAGVPDQIFGVVDDSYDDDDLPIAEDVVRDLRLSYEPNKALDKRFYKTQFRYLIRVVGDGEHIRYASEETVPVHPVGLKPAIVPLGKEGTDKVRLPSDNSRIFTRRRIPLSNQVTEYAILAEIASAKRYSHQHLKSIYGSYLFDENIYILLTPAAEWTLKTFLSDVPKAFDNLPKHERRSILVDWPHCLANALAWLHSHGQPHGAIRPSNVVVDNNFRICLGHLDGHGVLGAVIKPEDIESYQYAAPERWKRTVTMQTTGPAKVSGHSGGRTARKIKEQFPDSESKRSSWTTDVRLNTSAPNSIGYSFMPTAKGNFSRLQLGKSSSDSDISLNPRRSLDTRQSDHGSTDTVRPTTRSVRTDAPSTFTHTTSSSGSNKTMRAALMNSGSVFLAGPEVRTAVVQTWQSAQYNLFAADVFSLGAVILGILTLLSKKSAGSFERHRSSKNRTAGRGGGLADASFHANVGQVLLWADILQDDARKKAKKEDGGVFCAVGPMLQVLKRCLERDPNERILAKDLEEGLEEHIIAFAGIGLLHCRRELSAEPKPSKGRPHEIRSHVSTPVPRKTPSQNNPSDEILGAPPRADEWSKLRSKGLMTTTIRSPAPESSYSSMSSFNFEYDTPSETLVEDDRSHVTTEPFEGRATRPSTADARCVAEKFIPRAMKTETWNNWHNNDSVIDPRLSQSPSGGPPGFNYIKYSDSMSSEETEGPQKSFFLSESRPSSMAPQTVLPPMPTIEPDGHRRDSVRPEAFPAVPHRPADTQSRSRCSSTKQDPILLPRTSSWQKLQSPRSVHTHSHGSDLPAVSKANIALPDRSMAISAKTHS